jgi:NAD(P)-dependent dehydrogenase (short-subunit alcohol dehydrogenase family)
MLSFLNRPENISFYKAGWAWAKPTYPCRTLSRLAERNGPSRPLRARYYLGPNGSDLGGERFPGMQRWVRYQKTKLAHLLFTYALHDHANQQGGNKVKSLCAHPGPADSGLQAKTTQAGWVSMTGSLCAQAEVKSRAFRSG